MPSPGGLIESRTSSPRRYASSVSKRPIAIVFPFSLSARRQNPLLSSPSGRPLDRPRAAPPPTRHACVHLALLHSFVQVEVEPTPAPERGGDSSARALEAAAGRAPTGALRRAERATGEGNHAV